MGFLTRARFFPRCREDVGQLVMELLCEEAKRIGLVLGKQHLAQFDLYYRELAAWNQRFNLTTITGYEAVQRKHFMDSLTCLLAFPASGQETSVANTMPVQLDTHGLCLLDVGSGAGFPGLPLKIMLPGARVTLVESIGKKVAFLRHMIQLLDLRDVEVIQGRAEEIARLPSHRERYDVVVARAVAQLVVLSEYCLPFCRIGGRMIAQKGEDAQAETEHSAAAMERLGGQLVVVKAVDLSLGTARYLVVVDKVARTPDLYPRRVGVPSKRPMI